MTDKEFRHLKREELVEIIYQLQKNEAQLRKENNECRKRLEEKELKISNAGSIAEAALNINGVFEAAQAAADQYMQEVLRTSRYAEINAAQIIEDAKIQAAATIENAKSKEEKLLAEAESQAASIVSNAKAEERRILDQAKSEEKRILEQAENDAAFSRRELEMRLRKLFTDISAGVFSDDDTKGTSQS